MAFTIKDNITFTGTGTQSSVHMSNVANGDNLFLFIAVNQGSTGRISSVTDSKGNTYTKAGSYSGTGIEVECWFSMNATIDNGTTVTIAPTVGTDVWAAVWISSTGEASTNAFDKTVGSFGSSTSLDSTSTAATGSANEILFGVNGQANNRSWTTGTGYTQITSVGNGANAGIQVQYKIVSATGTYNETASLDIASNWVAGIFTFSDTPLNTKKTITGTARITAKTTQTITGKADILKTTTNTITGISKLVVATNKTITGVSRIKATTTKTITGVTRINPAGGDIVSIQTITGKSRLGAKTTNTITGVSNIVASQAPLFYTNCESLGDWTTVNQNLPNETVTIDGTGGYDGHGALKFTFNQLATNEIDVIKQLASTAQCRYAKFKLKVGATNTGNNSQHTLVQFWDNAQGGVFHDLLQLRLEWWPANTISGVSVPKWGVFLYYGNSDSTISPTPTTYQYGQEGSPLYDVGVYYDVEIFMTAHKFTVAINGKLACEWFRFTDTHNLYPTLQSGGQLMGFSNLLATLPLKYMNVMAMGKFYSTQLTGSIWIDEVYMDVAPPHAVLGTDFDKLTALWNSWKKRYLRADGAIVRPLPQDQSGTSLLGTDVVSEGVGYHLMFAVQMSDQTAFDSAENWAYNNIVRRSWTSSRPDAGVQNGSTALTYGTNMMGWHYDPITSKVLDWGWATDGDTDRLKALYWAHERWGSAGTINYKARADALWTDFKNNVFIYDTASVGAIAVQPADGSNRNPPIIHISPSYIDPSTFAVVLTHNPADSAIVNQAIAGTYFLLNSHTQNDGNLLHTLSGLPAEWICYNASNSTQGITAHDASVAAAGYPTSFNLPPHSVGYAQLSGQGQITYEFDAFRVPVRLYWHFKYYNNAQAKTWLTGQFMTFMKNIWTANSQIKATYNHDGTVTGNYEQTIMTWQAYFALAANNDPLADIIYNNKLAPVSDTIDYSTDTFADFQGDSPDQGGSTNDSRNFYSIPGYFGDAWAFMGLATKLNVWQYNLANGASTKTITGTARIQKTAVQQSITGVSKITNKSTQTITGVARVIKTGTTTQTITGVTRITTAAVLKTITGKARIQTNAVLQTVTGTARFTVSTQRLITGISTLSAATVTTTQKTITGVANIFNTTKKTITGISRVQFTTTQTITGVAHIAPYTPNIPQGFSTEIVPESLNVSVVI